MHMTHSKRAPHRNQSVSYLPKKIENKNNIDVHSALRPLHHVDVGGVGSVSEVHSASIFKVGLGWVSVHVHV
jgi:hypothetical protein